MSSNAPSTTTVSASPPQALRARASDTPPSEVFTAPPSSGPRMPRSALSTSDRVARLSRTGLVSRCSHSTADTPLAPACASSTALCVCLPVEWRPGTRPTQAAAAPRTPRLHSLTISASTAAYAALVAAAAAATSAAERSRRSLLPERVRVAASDVPSGCSGATTAEDTTAGVSATAAQSVKIAGWSSACHACPCGSVAAAGLYGGGSIDSQSSQWSGVIRTFLRTNAACRCEAPLEVCAPPWLAAASPECWEAARFEKPRPPLSAGEGIARGLESKAAARYMAQ
mmetsp:Transcript_10197/g.23604  ORF Transcript_10197/g.23604 Transcript_10197/m.23604 type:complete len:285 (-) Transcript_10197:166-1020(-)